jgi:hypothetical protein
MVTMLEGYITKEQRSVVIFFLQAKGFNAKDIHKDMLPVYSGKCLSYKPIHNWVQKFTQGRSKVPDDVRPGAKWLRHLSKNFYVVGFDTLVKQWDKCISVGGRYVEK